MSEIPPEQLRKRLIAAKNPSDYHRALKGAYEALNDLSDSYIEANGVKLDCCKGCSLCCYLRVDAKAHEVLAIADHVTSHFSDSERAELDGRLQKHKETVSPLSYPEHMATNVACPLLVDCTCSVYALRPFGCRRHQSTKLGGCQYSYDHPDDLHYPSSRDLSLFAETGDAENMLQSVYALLHFDRTGYELGTALKEALENPKTGRRWRKKIRAFLNAKTVPAHPA